MNTPKTKTSKMINKIKSLYRDTIKYEKKYSAELKKVHPSFKKSAKNLVDYISLRTHDINELQNNLGESGFSRLGRCESHVHASLLSTLDTLSNFKKVKDIKTINPSLSIKRGKKINATNTKALLGYRSKGRRVRIMVTLPNEAAEDYKLVQGLLSSGMNSARINCAVDGPEVWKKMIDNLNKAKKSVGKNCRIIMDLGGPKLRTGFIVPGPKVIHLRPEKDPFGNVIMPKSILLTNDPNMAKDPMNPHILVEGEISNIHVGDKLIFTDVREKNSTFHVKKKLKNALLIEYSDSVYLVPGLVLHSDTSNQPVLKIADIPPLEQKLLLKKDDILVLHKDQKPGEPAKIDPSGKVVHSAHISCTFPEVFTYVRKGEPVFFDDGKIEGVIQSVSANMIKIKIISAKESGSKLGADKGINLPKSKILLSGLSKKDKSDLKFISKYADTVAFSFVNSPKDVMQLIKELKKIKSKLGIIVKIETLQALKNFPQILLTAMRVYPVGIMIARGDLAIEGGWLNMAKIQEELLLFCNAAHIPVIWATQVLENLAKKGMPSRAEITDAAMSQRSECVMLNKGPFINDAILMLDNILKSMEPYRNKMSPMLPVLKKGTFIDFKNSSVK
jgi:pyruvate kinase